MSNDPKGELLRYLLITTLIFAGSALAKSPLTEGLVDGLFISEVEAQKTLDVIRDQLLKELAAGHKVSLPHLGTFTPKKAVKQIQNIRGVAFTNSVIEPVESTSTPLIERMAKESGMEAPKFIHGLDLIALQVDQLFGKGVKSLEWPGLGSFKKGAEGMSFQIKP